MEHAQLKNWTLLSPLPDLFQLESGARVAGEADWAARRAELWRYAVDMQYGGMPPEPEFLEVEPLYRSDRGDSYRIHTGRRAHPITFLMQVIWPGKRGRYPIVVDGDGCFPYVYLDEALDVYREAGVALVRFNRTELAHDIKEEKHEDGLYAVYPGMTFGALAAWAWGYHRCTDAVLQLGCADERMIAYTGHSRGGKTALLAGATDTRATVVNPNGSGAGGAGCYRIHAETLCEDDEVRRSERLADLLRNFPFWFGPEMQPYAEREEDLPFDEHFLKALVAPRVLLDTEALSDAWANPVGTYMTHRAAGEVWRFLGAEDRLLIHYRDGYHYHKPEDMAVLCNVMHHFLDGTPFDGTINGTPFDDIPPVHTWRCPEK